MADAVPSRPHIPTKPGKKRDTRKQVRVRPGMMVLPKKKKKETPNDQS